jgi:hypothetical protein
MAAQPIDRAAQKNSDYKNAAVQNVSAAPFFVANLGQFFGVVDRGPVQSLCGCDKNKIQIRYCV